MHNICIGFSRGEPNRIEHEADAAERATAHVASASAERSSCERLVLLRNACCFARLIIELFWLILHLK